MGSRGEKIEKKPWRETPLIESQQLSKAAGCRVFLKLETLQPSGSFKSRGVGNFCVQALHSSPKPSSVHFHTSSGGNAGLACVHAASVLGRPATVVVPTSTKPMMVAKLRAAGAQAVVQIGANWQEADNHLRQVVLPEAVARGEEPVYVPPFDHQDVWAGHATMVDEVRKQLEAAGEGPPEVVACSVGGGGLLCGVMQGVRAQGETWAKTTVVGVETKGADSMAQSLQQGELVTLPGITSQATSLGAVRVAPRSFELASKGQAAGVYKHAVLTDDEAIMGCIRLADDERILVEMACGVAVALCYDQRLDKALGRKVNKDDKFVLVVCGGQNVTTRMIEQWRSDQI